MAFKFHFKSGKKACCGVRVKKNHLKRNWDEVTCQQCLKIKKGKDWLEEQIQNKIAALQGISAPAKIHEVTLSFPKKFKQFRKEAEKVYLEREKVELDQMFVDFKKEMEGK